MGAKEIIVFYIQEVLAVKFVFLFLVAVHGLIHLMGFLKAYAFFEFNQLTQDISRPVGVLWLLATLLFLASGLFFAWNKQWWWIVGALAIVISQAVIFLSWQDAKFGTILNIIVLIVVIVGFGSWNFNSGVEKEVDELLSDGNVPEPTVITEDMLESVPSAVGRWLNNVGVVGSKSIQTISLKQKGLMKLKPDQKDWYPAEAVQYSTTAKPGFIWKVNMKMVPLVHVAGRDKFMDGKAEMTMKVASLIPVVNVSENEKTTRSTLQRYLMELAWYPSMALSPYITWESIDETTAKATMTIQDITEAATFYFSDKGDFLKVSAMRYREEGSDERTECIGEAKESRKVDGITIPTEMEISWVLDGGVFTWYKFNVSDVAFNEK